MKMATARNSGVLRTIHLMLIMVLFCPFAYGGLIHVDDDGQADFDNIQAGIDAAMDGDTVLVAPGEYVVTEPVTFRGKAITVKSEAGGDETIIRMGTPADPKRASVVIFENNETDASVLEGFTIAGGSGSSVLPLNEFCGGGILFNTSSGTVVNCTIVQNSARHGGGVIAFSGSSMTLIDCAVVDNTAKNGGGVMVYSGSSATLTNCIISGNSATGVTFGVDGYGGGLFCGPNSLLTLISCSFAENSAVRGGGGIHCWQNLSFTMNNSLITSNTVQYAGGGMVCDSGSAILNNCIIARNTGARWGGGLCIAFANSSMTISNCTIWGNSATEGGGIDCISGGSAIVTNSILWNNTATTGNEIYLEQAPTEFSITYSNVAGGRNAVTIKGGSVLNWDTVNIDVDPFFADPNNENYHLKSQAGRWDPNSQSWIQDDVTSPCIDAGDPNSDWTGEIWPHGERINMGAYGGTREASMSTKPESMSLPRVAYVYGSDDEATESYRSLLMSYGCPTTLVGIDDVTTAALDSCDLIIVANDTQHETTWSDPNIVAAIEDSGRPVVGLGDGGYDFFGLLGLSIGNPYGGHGSKNSIEVIDPNSSLFSMPYSIEIPQDRVLQLYTETHHVGIYLWPTIPETVTVFGNEENDIGYYPLVAEHNRYMLWGFSESPEYMTDAGRTLFINVVIWMANAGWDFVGEIENGTEDVWWLLEGQDYPRLW